MASVRKRTWSHDGKARTAWVVDYFDQEGKRRLKTFDKKKAADDYLGQVKEEVKKGIHTPDRISPTVAEAAKQWIEHGRREGLERSTLRQREAHVNHHINPLIGTTKLSRLSAPSVRAFTNLLRDKGRSQTMVKKVLGSVKAMLAYAESYGLVAHNVARGLRLRQSSREKQLPTIPTKAEIKAIIDKAEGRWRPLVVTAVFTGMRASELRGLAWRNVDFAEKVIRIRERADPWGTLGQPKSASGHREIPMAPIVLNTLKAWQIEQRRERTEKAKKAIEKGGTPPTKPVRDLVFPNGSGKVENHANIFNRGFVPAQIAAGLYTEEPETDRKGEPVLDEKGEPRMVKRTKYSLHDLRHFAASLFIEQGWPPKKVQELMGHASIQMTFDLYGHLFPSPEDDQKAMEQIQARLLG